MRRIVLLVVTALAIVGIPTVPGHAQAAPDPTGQGGDYRFAGAKGLLVFHVRTDRVRDFEDVIARIGRGLETTTNQVRRQQAAGWRVFRSTDTAASAVYVVSLDPVVPGADYDPVKMLTELAADDAQGLYDRLKAAVIRVERLDLRQIAPAR